jgi:DNA helicase-2/ATP-dependent DNA helicase PcrA
MNGPQATDELPADFFDEFMDEAGEELDTHPEAHPEAQQGPGLNEPQRVAVGHAAGPLLIFAGAGSGKTRVITYRVANLVARMRVPPYRILAVTFTNKAAQEMSHRLTDMLGETAKDVWVGTFHATCAKLLRRHGMGVGVPSNFVIYDTSDQKSLMTRVLRELELDERRYPPRAVLSRVHKEKQEGRRAAHMSLDSYLDDGIQKAFALYDQKLRQAGALDFEDLILSTLELAESDTPEGQALRSKFHFVLVDEFQDTNHTQYRLLRAFAGNTKNLCVVGDDDQSIYRWRGADVRNIRGFRADYPDARVVKLEQNYRSSKTIVAAALGVIARSSTREPKELWTANDDGDPIVVLETSDERDEAAAALALIRDARERGVPLSDVALFYRVHAQSRVFEEALRAERIPYQIIGGAKFYERAEVKDALAYLRLLVNPESDVDLLRIINVPARGIGQTTVERLVSLATARRQSLFSLILELDQVLSGDEARGAGGKALLQAAARKRIGQLAEMLVQLTREMGSLLPHDLLDRVLAQTGYRAALEAEDSSEAEARLENLGELRGSLRDYSDEAEARGERPTISGFLERVTLQADTDALGQDGKVTLMTVHGAKGLEFDTVLLTGMEEDMFPYRGMSNDGGLDREELDEERRLAYVAITRARRVLYITHTRLRQIFGTTRFGTPSRFIADMPKGVWEQRTTPRARSDANDRYIDRPGRALGALPPGRGVSSLRATPYPTRGPGTREGTREGMRPTPPPPAPEGRYIEPEYVDDGEGIRPGTKVFHPRFGEGQVRKVLELAEPAVIAFFPGWGEMKVLARFLSLR